MLAGRKLLLADDSITIQKVVDLTFADEGVSVVCVNNGREAIERLEEFAPDIVLADVFMPQMNGYEVCQYIKQNEKLKNIPVMLLVGSFEPFDEAEARRVGADDTLTKPFQSIRRLIDKVGILLGSRPPEEQIPTAQLPKPEVAPKPEPERFSEAKMAMITADTQPFPAELREVVENTAMTSAKNEGVQLARNTDVGKGKMESKVTGTQTQFSESSEGAGDMLLDLGDYQPEPSARSEVFVLDIDLDEGPESSPLEASGSRNLQKERPASDTGWETVNPKPIEDPFATTRDLSRGIVPGKAPTPVEEVKEPATETTSPAGRVEEGRQGQHGGTEAASQNSLAHLSPEMIDTIARRAVEHLSERVVREIAWEVVPQLAELLIKRQLEEKNS